MNKVILIGALFKDPEARTTATNKTVVNFGILVSDIRNSKVTHIFNCVAWEQRAEFLLKYVKKGSLISVDGRLESRKYTNKEGKEVSIVEISADNISFAPSRTRNDDPNIINPIDRETKFTTSSISSNNLEETIEWAEE